MTYAEYLQKATRIGVSIDCVEDDAVNYSEYPDEDYGLYDPDDSSEAWLFRAGREIYDYYWNKEDVEALISFEKEYTFTEEHPMCTWGYWRELVDSWDNFLEFVNR